jgi:very-short-patch-repair endonuclease
LFTKVRLGDALDVDRTNAPGRAGEGGWQSARNRIDRKHVDVLLCSPSDTRPILVIELDDKSHQRKDRQDRDTFVDAACQGAGLPVLHITCIPPSASYDPRQLAAQMTEKLKV